jgi:hypothetical protein
MAIIFSLPWALLMWAYVCRFRWPFFELISLTFESVRQDGDVFRRAAARMFRHLEPVDTDLYCGDISHGGCPRWVVHPMVLEVR